MTKKLTTDNFHILAAQRGKIEKNKKPEIVSIPKMLRDLRRAESDSELVFILTEKDILFCNNVLPSPN